MVAETDKVIVRLVCVVKGAPEDEFPITFEVMLQKGGIAKGKAYFGFQGTLSDELHPFVLRPDGRLDYGSNYEDDQDRFIICNILNKKIELGTIFTTRERDPETDRVREYVYSIKKIVLL
jgi:hypothetical protein